MFLYYSNVTEGSNILMFDSTRGLGLGAIATRLDGRGHIDLCHSPNLD